MISPFVDIRFCSRGTRKWLKSLEAAAESKYADFKPGDLDRYCVIDFNHYRGKDGEIVVKELAIITKPEFFPFHWVFLPPYYSDEFDDAMLIEQLEMWKSFMRYDYDEGNTPYSQLDGILEDIGKKYDKIFFSEYGDNNIVKDCNDFLASKTKTPIYDFSSLYQLIRYCEVLRDPDQTKYLPYKYPAYRHNRYKSIRYRYADVCPEHEKKYAHQCPKARCNYKYSIIRSHEKSICVGTAKVRVYLHKSSNDTEEGTSTSTTEAVEIQEEVKE